MAIRKKSGSLINRSIEIGLENLDTLTKNLKNEEERDLEKIKIVKQSIDNGWGGFFEIKNKKVKENQKRTEEIPENLDSLYCN